MHVRVYRKFLGPDGRLDFPALRALCATGERGPVATCECGGYVMADCPVQPAYRGVQWAQLTCLACGHEIACPDGRLAHTRDDSAAYLAG